MKRLDGFQKPLSRPRQHKTQAARVSEGEGFVECSCGWVFVHKRDKVRQKSMKRHLDKWHQGRGIWL